VAVSLALAGSGRLAEAGAGALAACCAIVGFAGIAFWLDDGDLRMVLGWLLRMARGSRQASPSQPAVEVRAATTEPSLVSRPVASIDKESG